MPMPKLCVLKSEQEAALARTTKPMQVRIPRRAASVLAAEVERRIARGVYPSAESLIGEAVTKAFAGGRAHETVFCCGMWHGISGSGRLQTFWAELALSAIEGEAELHLKTEAYPESRQDTQSSDLSSPVKVATPPA